MNIHSGGGVQGELQPAAVAAVLPLRHAWALDSAHERTETMAARATASLGFQVGATQDRPAALRESDVCVTCTLLIARS